MDALRGCMVKPTQPVCVDIMKSTILVLITVTLAKSSSSSESMRLTGWVSGLPTNTSAGGYVLPLTLDCAISGWVCDLNDPNALLRVDIALGGKHVGSANVTGASITDSCTITTCTFLALLHLYLLSTCPCDCPCPHLASGYIVSPPLT